MPNEKKCLRDTSRSTDINSTGMKYERLFRHLIIVISSIYKSFL